MRGTDARWYSMPTPCPAGPQAVSIARRVKPRCSTRSQKWKLQERKLDGRGYRGAQVAAFSSAAICNNRLGES